MRDAVTWRIFLLQEDEWSRGRGKPDAEEQGHGCGRGLAGLEGLRWKEQRASVMANGNSSGSVPSPGCRPWLLEPHISEDQAAQTSLTRKVI